MTVPTQCYLITTRNDCFCPEKAVGFYMSEEVAIRIKGELEKRDDCNYHVVPCIIMPTETFYELCPDWKHDE